MNGFVKKLSLGVEVLNSFDSNYTSFFAIGSETSCDGNFFKSLIFTAFVFGDA